MVRPFEIGVDEVLLQSNSEKLISCLALMAALSSWFPLKREAVGHLLSPSRASGLEL